MGGVADAWRVVLALGRGLWLVISESAVIQAQRNCYRAKCDWIEVRDFAN